MFFFNVFISIFNLEITFLHGNIINFTFELSEKVLSESNWNYDVVIAGNKPFKYSIHDTDKGLSVTPQGQNLEFANEILIAITSDIPSVVPKRQEFIGIISSVYNKIKEHYKNKDDYIVDEVNCSSVQINLIISKNK